MAQGEREGEVGEGETGGGEGRSGAERSPLLLDHAGMDHAVFLWRLGVAEMCDAECALAPPLPWGALIA